MQGWAAASLVFFVYLAAVADFRRVTRRARLGVWTGCAIGVAMVIASSRLQGPGLANTWILPPAVLLVGYRTSGLLFVRPMPRAERVLAALDERLRVGRIAAGTPRWIAESLELAYTGIYPLVLVAFAVAQGLGVEADRFWTVVLVSDFVCFGMLPWIQTRPPRSLTEDGPWQSSWRPLNLRLVHASSVQVNTFPSGHAAEATVVALLLTSASAPVVATMFVAAFAVSAGAVFGRYHYAADVCAGWAVAVAVFAGLHP